MGHRIETWARQTKHADGITWFLSQLQAEARADPHSELEWSVPTARSDRAYNWGDSAIAPDAVGQMTAQGLRIPFYFEYELRARHPRGVIARLRPYEDAITMVATSRGTTSRRTPSPCSSWTPRRSRRPTSAPQPACPGCPCPSSCPASLSYHARGYLESPGVHCGNRSPRHYPCQPLPTTSGTVSTTGCVPSCRGG